MRKADKNDKEISPTKPSTLRKGWENAATPPWNLRLSVVTETSEIEDLVVQGFAQDEGIVLIEVCLGAKSPNPAAILERHLPKDSFVTMDARGYIAFANESEEIANWVPASARDTAKKRAKAAATRTSSEQAIPWRSPFWELRPEGAFVASFDHHGQRDGEPGAFSQVYHTAFGCLHNHPKPHLVLTTGIDEDLVGATVAALGALPHPEFFKVYYPDIREEAARQLYRDMSELVQLVDTVDTDMSRVIELLNTGLGRSLLAWRESLRPEFLGSFFIGHACQRFIELFCLDRDTDIERLAIKRRKERLNEVTQVPKRSLGDSMVLVADLTGFTANAAFYEKLLVDHPFGVFVLGDWASGRGRITFAARTLEEAVQYLGKGGLKRLYRRIPGAGGHPNLGGAPWGGEYNFEDEGIRFGNILLECIEQYRKQQEKKAK